MHRFPREERHFQRQPINEFVHDLLAPVPVGHTTKYSRPLRNGFHNNTLPFEEKRGYFYISERQITATGVYQAFVVRNLQLPSREACRRLADDLLQGCWGERIVVNGQLIEQARERAELNEGWVVWPFDNLI